jgi:hypothetical protein
MEKLLALSKGTYLLEAPFEVLHEESMEWLEEIEFWKDEAAFFYTLIMDRTKTAPLLKTKQAKEVERHLIYVSAERLDDLKIEVQSHEKFLSRIMDDPHLDEQLYRNRHKVIAKKFHDFEKEFRLMKKKIFILAKKRSKK